MKYEILVCGASFAGLSTAYWMNKLSHNVTVFEIAAGIRKGGTPVNIKGNTIDIVSRMGLLQIRSNKFTMEVVEFKNFADMTQKSDCIASSNEHLGEYEIERDVLLSMMFEAVQDDVEFVFGDSLASSRNKLTV